MYLILWRFRPRAGAELEFEQAYGPEGEWAQLFRRAEGYLGTELARATNDSGYLTIDRWSAPGAFEAFRRRWREDYEALDARCENLTEEETPLGSFVSA